MKRAHDFFIRVAGDPAETYAEFQALNFAGLKVPTRAQPMDTSVAA